LVRNSNSSRDHFLINYIVTDSANFIDSFLFEKNLNEFAELAEFAQCKEASILNRSLNLECSTKTFEECPRLFKKSIFIRYLFYSYVDTYSILFLTNTVLKY